MATGEICSELLRLLKLQRHDFINHLQIIHAMLQLGRVEKALRYIEDLSRDQALVTDQLASHKELANCQRKTGT